MQKLRNQNKEMADVVRMLKSVTYKKVFLVKFPMARFPCSCVRQQLVCSYLTVTSDLVRKPACQFLNKETCQAKTYRASKLVCAYG